MRGLRLTGVAATTLWVSTTLWAADQPSKQPQGPGSENTKLFNIASKESCIAGHNPFSENTTGRIRGLSEQSFAEYIRLAGSGDAVNVRSLYTNKRNVSGWDGTSFAKTKVVVGWNHDGIGRDVVSINDPLARAIVNSGVKLEEMVKLETFLVGGAKLTAMGRWRIADPIDPSKTLGRYRVYFMRENSLGGQLWKLISLDMSNDSGTSLEVKQYCVQPGDVERNIARLQRDKAKR